VAKHHCWYVVHTHPKQEDRALSNFKLWELETFLPRCRNKRYNHFTGDITYVVKPLFPSYIFVRFSLNDLYHRIRFTRGVHSLVSFAGNPCPVEDEIIDFIRLQVGDDGLVKVGAEFKPGDRVIIREGPLRRLSGVFERELTDAERVAVLLDSVSFQVRVMAERHTLEKLG
jgi:transcriptional antiterminator RfaH